MKNSKPIILLFLAVVITALGVTIYFYSAYQKKVEELAAINRSLEIHQNLLSDYQHIQLYNLMAGLDSLDNISLVDINEQKHNLYDLFNDKAAIFYIENGMCEICITKELENIQQISKVVGRDRIIILAKGYSIRYLYNADVFKKWRDILFLSEEAPMILNSNFSGTPSILIVDNNYIVRGAYHALKSTNINFDIFLRTIQRSFARL